MKRTILLLSIFLSVSLFAGSPYSIVFVHIGPAIPEYAEDALKQARLFNQDCKIVMLAEKKAIQASKLNQTEAKITCVAIEELKRTKEHERYCKENKWKEGFWLYTTERLFVLGDYINQYDEKNIFHMEYDNMLYADLSTLLPVFQEHYRGIAATFDNDDRCIPGFLFVSDKNGINPLTRFIAENRKQQLNDMQLLALFKNTKGKTFIDHLPIITREYVESEALVSPMNHVAKNPLKYCLYIDLFDSIFDAAALGQYLGGIDPRNGPSLPGFINESCVFNPSCLEYEWILDTQNRKVPFAVYKGEKYRINNLHIHSKNLSIFSSQGEPL